MPLWSPVGEIRYPINGVDNFSLDGYVKAPPPGSQWDIFSGGFRWVRPGVIVTTPPESFPLHVRTAIRNAEGDIPVTLYSSGNGSSLLVGVYEGWISCVFQMRSTPPDWMISTYCTNFRRQMFSYEWQQIRFHPNTVGVSQFICRQFMKGIFSNPR